MLILHGTWCPDLHTFALWAEDPSHRWTVSGDPSNSHPGAASKQSLIQALSPALAEADVQCLRNVPIWLPGDGHSPSPSPAALAVGASPEIAALCHTQFTLPSVLSLKPQQMLILSSLEQQCPDIFCGPDMVFWRYVIELGAASLISQTIEPGLKRHADGYVAHWSHGADGIALLQLSRQMPHLCRALGADPRSAPLALTLINDALDAMVDTTVRQICEASLPPRYRHRWVRALTSQNAQLSGASPENKDYYANWSRWRNSTMHTQNTYSRVCFRLEEPTPENDQWYLRYLLQSTSDTSLYVEASVIWSTSDDELSYLNRHLHHPREKLLAGLTRASHIFSPIKTTHRDGYGAGVALSIAQAREFLTKAAPVLRRNHLGVLVPDWWADAGRVRARAVVGDQPPAGTGLLRRDSLINYRWELAIGDQTLTREEFEQLVSVRQPLVQWQGRWIALSENQIEAALRFFDKQQTQGGLLDTIELISTSGEMAEGSIEIDEIEVAQWLDELVSKLRDPSLIGNTDTPASLQGALRPYQLRGLGWLTQMRRLGLGACLADDMGLGKTIQTIALWLKAREDDRIDSPTLVVCPTSVIGNWGHEIRRFAPSLRVLTHHGPERSRGSELADRVTDYDVIITSYALLTRDRDTLTTIHWDAAVLDEAQNIKNPSTKQAQTARALNVDHRLALTGTPVENRLAELWSIFQFLNPGYLGSRTAFQTQFAHPIERRSDSNAADHLKQMISPFILRRVKSDPAVIQDLPEKFESKVYCTLTPEQASLYEAVVREELEAIENTDGSMKRRGGILRMLTRLKQICNHPAHFTGNSPQPRYMGRASGKLARLQEMAEQILEADEHMLIFTQYAKMGKLLEQFLTYRFSQEVLFLHGGTPSKQREKMITRFQSRNGPSIFVLSLKAGGTGLNLTRASVVFHYDRWYNPAVENQATDRAYRIGQTRDVQVNKLICLGTLEEQIDELIECKQALADTIVGTSESYISEMSNDELVRLVTLRREATRET